VQIIIDDRIANKER